MQCGPIRFNVGSKKQAAASAFQYEVIPRLTELTVPPEWNDIGIQDIYTALIQDDQRSDLIVADVVAAIEDGRFPLLLTNVRTTWSSCLRSWCDECRIFL
jgi:flagellar biosynthesis/type III secretory pathway ATPase